MLDELHTRGLPKWPQMYTTGSRVSVEQAREIIRRTDQFFVNGYGGNNKALNTEVRSLLRMGPSWLDLTQAQFKDKEFSRRVQDFEASWRTRWNVIHTQYVHNAWLSNAFMGGPHGWCHPDGGIGFVDNVGKWPSVDAVAEDWQELARHFPFLDIGVTLMDGESCEEGIKPIVSIRVKGGEVTLVDPDKEHVHEGHPEAQRTPRGTPTIEEEMHALFNNPMRETDSAVYGWVREHWMALVADWPRFA